MSHSFNMSVTQDYVRLFNWQVALGQNVTRSLALNYHLAEQQHWNFAAISCANRSNPLAPYAWISAWIRRWSFAVWTLDCSTQRYCWTQLYHLQHIQRVSCAVLVTNTKWTGNPNFHSSAETISPKPNRTLLLLPFFWSYNRRLRQFMKTCRSGSGWLMNVFF